VYAPMPASNHCHGSRWVHHRAVLIYQGGMARPRRGATNHSKRQWLNVVIYAMQNHDFDYRMVLTTDQLHHVSAA
jgi:hypothetical protein